jgi:hypothetical protein
VTDTGQIAAELTVVCKAVGNADAKHGPASKLGEREREGKEREREREV